MTWNGSHPKMSRQEAKSLLPPGACKKCVYKVRIGLVDEPAKFSCHRCSGTSERRGQTK
jgi:predicted Zn-ribbon and HTH transcriptional regulator